MAYVKFELLDVLRSPNKSEIETHSWCRCETPLLSDVDSDEVISVNHYSRLAELNKMTNFPYCPHKFDNFQFDRLIVLFDICEQSTKKYYWTNFDATLCRNITHAWALL